MSAVTDAKSGDVILKVVNASAKAIKTEIELKEAKNLTGTGTAAVLTSASPLWVQANFPGQFADSNSVQRTMIGSFVIYIYKFLTK